MVALKGVTYLPSKDIVKVQTNEIVLKENTDRWVMFPIEHDNFWAMYKELENNFWAAEDFIFSEDDVKSVSDEFLRALNQLLSYHIMMDHNKTCRPATLTLDLLSESQVAEARAFYGFQLTDENIHSETMCLMLQATGTKLDLEAGKQKVEWLFKHVKETKCFFKKVLLSSVTKLVFSASLSLFKDYLHHSKLLPTYTSAIGSIIMDRCSHVKFAYSLFMLLEYKIVKEEIYTILKEAKDLEVEYCTKILPLEAIGLTKDDVISLVEHLVNEILVISGYDLLYKPDLDVAWINYLKIDTNFKFTNPRAKMHKTVEQFTTEINFDEDF